MGAVLGILGTDSGYHPAAALVVDGRLVAFAEEERFSGHKGGHVSFPARAARWCLREGGLEVGQLQQIAYGWDCARYRWELPLRFALDQVRYRSARDFAAHDTAARGRDGWLRGATWLATHRPGWVEHRVAQGLRAAGHRGALPPLRFYPHHRCHAASAFYLSGFEDAAVLTLDGSGEDVATVGWRGWGLQLDRRFAMPLPHSLGWVYSAFTEYLGFEHSRHEGKVMGLAAYGGPADDYVRAFEDIVRVSSRGYEVGPSWGKYGRRSVGEHFADRVIDRFGPPRLPGEPLTRRHQDIAWALQHRIEEAVAATARRLCGELGTRRLCLAGGVAMNCKLNGSLLQGGVVDELFVQPAADDSGAALGAALLGAVDCGDDPRRRQRSVALGPQESPDDVRGVLRSCGATWREPDDLPVAVAELLAAGKVVGWVQGRMEAGARALGQRSILANPVLPDMRDRVNLQVKLREPWRPYSPSMTPAAAARAVGEPVDRPFMIVADQVTDEAAAALPSVVHVDGSVRAQTVYAEQSPLYHALLQRLGERTGWEVALNTSFNVRGEPIVLDTRRALRTFAGTGMDALAVGPCLVEKPPTG